mmetsp:Transcript_8398/g.14458  ORF Transcript_8398/g.14458 Transcript_8398/m.14458 type:complete len:133 (-) Transcript_8398:206-604(-)|eukprot:CAMPEP_0198198508 /NCGR_PEP_ID=MMETSP1445-20131203/1980_1 /TAXON_ID=36898 /ORGANISM="Pyramimonas sp., Strain CCMP2087" /LENGTH=132 /DNA_ID=CAMNT_0043868097 /DNA_START=134 /DNA_END=532 /DNA_ORIENTATION=+
MRVYQLRRALLGFALAWLCVLGNVESVSAKKSKKYRNNKSPSQDREFWAKRSECEPIVERDTSCVTAIDKENCILKCVSDACYKDVYGSDQLEDGEVDTVRGKSFKNCVKTEIKEKEQAISKIEMESARDTQ